MAVNGRANVTSAAEQAEAPCPRARTIRRWLLLGSLTVMFCCGATKLNVVPMGSGLHPPPKPDDCTVPIYRTQKPTEPYKELATIESIGSAATSSETVNKDLIREACRLGADALIISEIPSQKPGCGGYSGPSTTAVAIIFSGEGGSSPSKDRSPRR